MKIVIEGAGQVGSHLARLLSSADNDICVIDSDEERLQSLANTADVVTIQAKASSIKHLKEAGVKDADLFIAVNPYTQQDVNIVSSLISKKLGCPKVCARIDNEEYLNYENKYMFTEMGVDMMFYPEKIAALEICNKLKNSTTADYLDFARGKLQMAVFKIEEDSPLLEMKLSEFSALMASSLSEFRIVAVSREHNTIIPKHDTRFQFNDLIFIICKRAGLQALMTYLGKTQVNINKIMILGGGRIGAMLAQELAPSAELIKIIEKDRLKCSQIKEQVDKNVLVVNGDGRNSDLLLEENLKEYDAFVAVTGNDEANVLACVVAKKLGLSKTVAEVENMEYIRIAEDMGVDVIINKKILTAGKIYKMTLSNKAKYVKYMSQTNAEVLEYLVTPGAKITKAKLKDLAFPTDAIIGGYIRGNESFIAIGESKIENYDRVAVFALPHVVKEVDSFFK